MLMIDQVVEITCLLAVYNLWPFVATNYVVAVAFDKPYKMARSPGKRSWTVFLLASPALLRKTKSYTSFERWTNAALELFFSRRTWNGMLNFGSLMRTVEWSRGTAAW
ncbi:hypothetical protein QR680_018989 [Steinernema hermaphroditum]|uniref:Uncharacterized protein n=1 Tax=Steinernema hermaphroditum TaxID=289476 RepID=A0AA39LRW6_9BILA|nr:hypothetical protein QR680_018989 [Steinernema hermaphroditum]